MSRFRTRLNDGDKALDLVREVISNDFPSIKIEAFLGFHASEDEDRISGQFAEANTQIIYSFTFGRKNPKVTLQRYM